MLLERNKGGQSTKRPDKIGLNLLRDESLSWGLRISKLTSTRHKNILLRIAHGDIYTKDKLLRYGMGNDNCCGRCNQIEDLRHKFIECPYTKLIWAEVKKLLKLDQLELIFLRIVKRSSTLGKLPVEFPTELGSWSTKKECLL